MNHNTKARRRSVFLNCTTEQYAQIKAEACRREMTIGQLVMALVAKALRLDEQENAA